MSNTEVTYELWYEVKTWAEDNGYTFAYDGKEGSMGTAGAAPTTNKNHPVVEVSWRDAVVWCNAYSQKKGLTPVYYYDNEVLKVAETKNEADNGNGKADNCTVKEDANGYRLPLLEEWEFAAKSGDSFNYSGSDDYNEVGWIKENSDAKTHPVKQKKANSFGLYDMTGNVKEWCFEKCGSYVTRYTKGGSYNTEANWAGLSPVGNSDPTYNYEMGFRPVRNVN